MNMIRVWGGGQYESETFYETCDELGLMVWQDLMFACALYPSTDEFIDDVEPEIRHQVQRLKDHVCIAIWCGDNEVIGALNWYDEAKKNRDRYVVNYDRLNRKLAEFVTDEDPSRKFWASSPCNGNLDYGDAWHDDSVVTCTSGMCGTLVRHSMPITALNHASVLNLASSLGHLCLR